MTTSVSIHNQRNVCYILQNSQSHLDVANFIYLVFLTVPKMFLFIFFKSGLLFNNDLQSSVEFKVSQYNMILEP